MSERFAFSIQSIRNGRILRVRFAPWKVPSSTLSIILGRLILVSGSSSSRVFHHPSVLIESDVEGKAVSLRDSACQPPSGALAIFELAAIVCLA